jgi:hypothetical protein
MHQRMRTKYPHEAHSSRFMILFTTMDPPHSAHASAWRDELGWLCTEGMGAGSSTVDFRAERSSELCLPRTNRCGCLPRDPPFQRRLRQALSAQQVGSLSFLGSHLYPQTSQRYACTVTIAMRIVYTQIAHSMRVSWSPALQNHPLPTAKIRPAPIPNSTRKSMSTKEIRG